MVNLITFPRQLQTLITTKARYKIAYGGRGGGKSWAVARALLLRGIEKPQRILCAREFQVSINDSVHRLLSDQISALNLDSFYVVQRTQILGKNGTIFLFSGLKNNITKIKSFEGIDVCWVEEAERVSENSWEILIPTIRKANSEIWVTFNPHSENDPTYKRFVKNPPPNSIVTKVCWYHNPWIPKELVQEKDYLYKVDPDIADHIWGGEPRNVTDAQVLRGRYRVESIQIGDDVWDGPYFGADWGFAADPTALVRCWVDSVNRVLYIDYEAYGIGVEIDKTPELFRKIPDSNKYIIRSDSARPETISYMQRHGFPRVVKTFKGKGSVEDGVEFLRSYSAIVIHPRCVHTATEARLWSYKVDRLTGDVLPVLEDKHNHCFDAVRYALEPIIRKRELTSMGVKVESL